MLNTLYLRAAFVLFACFSMFGCATLTNGDSRSEFISSVAIQTATMRFIEESSKPTEYAEKAIEIAEAIRDNLKGDVITAKNIGMMIDSKVPYSKMPPSDQFLARSLTQLIVAEIDLKIDKSSINEDLVLSVKKIADLVISSAKYYVH